MTQSALKVLLLGVEGTGKSLLLKRLQHLSSDGLDTEFKDIPSTIATVGSNLVYVTFNKINYEFREVGGAMAPIWKNYYKDTDVVIYMIDKPNQFQISSSCVMLLTILANEMLHDKKILILFNKSDILSTMSLMELKKIYRLADIVQQRKVTIAECSCVTKYGFFNIVEWLQNATS